MNIGGHPYGPQELELFEAEGAFLTSSIALRSRHDDVSSIKKDWRVAIVIYVNTLKKGV